MRKDPKRAEFHIAAFSFYIALFVATALPLDDEVQVISYPS